MAREPIKVFRGTHRFLSNFYRLATPIAHMGVTWPTVEHAYQAEKFMRDHPHVVHKIRQCVSPAAAKMIAREYHTLVEPGFHDRKVLVMTELVRLKFRSSNSLRRRLLDTGKRDLIEGNWWDDKFWGVCMKTGEGENRLGLILMQVREECRQRLKGGKQ